MPPAPAPRRSTHPLAYEADIRLDWLQSIPPDPDPEDDPPEDDPAGDDHFPDDMPIELPPNDDPPWEIPDNM